MNAISGSSLKTDNGNDLPLPPQKAFAADKNGVRAISPGAAVCYLRKIMYSAISAQLRHRETMEMTIPAAARPEEA